MADVKKVKISQDLSNSIDNYTTVSDKEISYDIKRLQGGLIDRGSYFLDYLTQGTSKQKAERGAEMLNNISEILHINEGNKTLKESLFEVV
jgi:hypothetical protein